MVIKMYKDRTFCNQRCGNTLCYRNYYALIAREGEYYKNLWVSFADFKGFHGICEGYREVDDNQEIAKYGSVNNER